MEKESNGGGVYEVCGTIKKQYSDEAIQTAFNLILKMVNNIIKNPNEPKFRTFKKTNEAIKSKILIIKETEKLMKELGFVEDGNDVLVYKEAKVDKLQKGVDIMETFKRDVDENIRIKEVQKQSLKDLERLKLNEEVNARMREEARKKKELLNQIELDKKERATKEKATDSKANDLKFGATLKKFECKQPRG